LTDQPRREHPRSPAIPPQLQDDPDRRKGAVEGSHPNDPQPGNANAPALDEQGLPSDPVAIAEDEIGANEDQSRG
jgi:hypothetical protein